MRFPRKLAGLLLAAGMAAGTAAAAAPARASTLYDVFSITSGSNNICLEADPGPDFAYRVTTQTCNYQNPAQQWMSFTDGGFTKFRNHAVGWCLDAHVPIPNLNGAPVILWDCSATFSDDRWSLTLGLGFGTIQSRAWNSTGYCLTVPGGRTSPGSGHSYSPATATPPSQVVLATLVSA